LKANAGRALQVLDQLQQQPVSQIKSLAQRANLSIPTTSKALEDLVNVRIVREITGGSYGRTYVYQPYLQLLGEETMPAS
jgi:DNA-binding IclR family transcriptional regulator